MSEGLEEYLKLYDGYWKYSGGKYLAKLTSGKISDVFINTGVVTCNPVVLQDVVMQLCKLHGTRLFQNLPDFVVSPAMGGITLGYEVAKCLGVPALFTEPKYKSHPVSTMEGVDHVNLKDGQELKRWNIDPECTVLFVEDVVSTGKSTREMVDAVCEKCPGVKFLPYVLCLVNRAPFGSMELKDKSLMKIISLMNVDIKVWDTLELAQKIYPNVVDAVRPKKNWNMLKEGN